MEMTKSTKLNHVASSVSMNPLSEFKSPESGYSSCKYMNERKGDYDQGDRSEDEELKEEITMSKSAFLSRRLSSKDRDDVSFLLAAGEETGYSDSSFDDSIYLHPTIEASRSTKRREKSGDSYKGEHGDEEYEDDKDNSIERSPCPSAL